MEKETKEWGNMEQRAMLNTLRIMFPQVRNLFGTCGSLFSDPGFRPPPLSLLMIRFVFLVGE